MRPSLKIPPAPRVTFRPRMFGRLGLTPTSTAGSAAQGLSVGAAVGGASAAAIGAATGSVVGPVGTAVGALIGVIVGILSTPDTTASHIGSWDTQLAAAVQKLPTTVAGVGRQMLWNNDSNGLTQMLEACLATGIWMSWDPSLASSYDVCAHWAMTYAAAAQTAFTAVCKNPKGAKVTVSITNEPGQGGVGPGNFTFTNPGILVGPEAVAASVAMGSTGFVHWMMSRVQIAGTPALSAQYANNTASNATVQKIFALMVDYIAGQLGVADSATPVPNVSAVPAAAATATKTAIAQVGTTAAPKSTATVIAPSSGAVSTPAPVTAATTTATPVATTASGETVTDADISNLITSMQAQGTSQDEAISQALEQLESQGVDTSQPAVQAAVSNATGGISLTDILIGAGLLVGIYFLATE